MQVMDIMIMSVVVVLQRLVQILRLQKNFPALLLRITGAIRGAVPAAVLPVLEAHPLVVAGEAAVPAVEVRGVTGKIPGMC